jgi:hypothetical protein
MKNFRFLIIMLLSFSYCGEQVSETESEAITEDSSQLRLEIVAANFQEKTSLSLIDEVFKNSSIASGPPKQFAIYLTNISLLGLDDSGVSRKVPIFKSDSDRGVRLKISSGLTDITELFTNFSCFDSEGSVIDMPSDETCECGVYKTDGTIVKKIENSQGEKLCPWNKDFKSSDDSSASENQDTNEEEETFNMDDIIMPSAAFSVPSLKYISISISYKVMADVLGCVHGNFVEHSNYPGEHTYCTQYAYHINSGSKPSHSAFKNKGPSMSKIFLKKSYEENYSDTDELTFKIKNPLTLKLGEKADLSIAIDTNRMLRFFNQGRDNEGPNPSFPVDRSYFFTTVFESSIFVFAGRSGKIQGYEWLAQHCANENGCAENDNDKTYIRGWMTVIFDSNNNPYVNNVMPDDDNTRTILKGSNQGAGGIDSSLFTKKSVGIYDCSIKLEEKTATFKNVNLSSSLGSVQETIFEGLYGSQGPVTITRKL